MLLFQYCQGHIILILFRIKIMMGYNFALFFFSFLSHHSG